ncbi:MAG: carboxymuconolactone decarboxylase family protein [Planctomycetes bacterium]|nr:carboxymuconolactone decarboxylase family protein [Planctomycetota bacterium]
MRRLPKSYRTLQRLHPGVTKSHARLVKACLKAGPLAPRWAELVKLGISLGAGLEGGTHSHTHQAIEAGAKPSEIRHAVILSTSMIGMSRMMQARKWVEETLKEHRK